MPRIPCTLPLEAYAGTYYHAGYRSLTFKVGDHKDTCTTDPIQVLIADSQHDRTWPHTIRLEHVSSEHWIAYLKVAEWDESVTKAEFRIGEDGNVSELGIACEVSWTIEEKVELYKKFWFKKIDG